jgi:uncharacterized protein YecE (DUF72 family)
VSSTAPQLFVGSPMWAHKPWFGTSLPSLPRSGSELAVYSAALNAVEGNTTFYALPAPATIARWAEQASPGFRFVFKAPREVTHDRRLRQVGGLLDEFVALLDPLGDKVGSITLQLPGSFGPADLPVLAAVLRDVPAARRWSVEVRHPAFFEGDGCSRLVELLRSRDAEWVMLDSRTLFGAPPTSDIERETWARKPRLPVLAELLGQQPIVRFIGRDDVDATIAGWQDWLPIVAAWLAEGRTPTFFVHTPDNQASPTLARAFHAAVGLLVPSLVPLPELPATHDEVEQPSLF